MAKKNITMLSKDAIAASLAECFVTIKGRRYNLMQLVQINIAHCLPCPLAKKIEPLNRHRLVTLVESL